MAQAIGLEMKGLAFQWKVMNDAEPSPKMLANYENNITSHQVKVLFYNNQVTDPTTSQVLSLAKKSDKILTRFRKYLPPREF